MPWLRSSKWADNLAAGQAIVVGGLPSSSTVCSRTAVKGYDERKVAWQVIPGKVSGDPLLKNTRLPVDAITGNYDAFRRASISGCVNIILRKTLPQTHTE
jgi:hypothetical protein